MATQVGFRSDPGQNQNNTTIGLVALTVSPPGLSRRYTAVTLLYRPVNCKLTSNFAGRAQATAP